MKEKLEVEQSITNAHKKITELLATLYQPTNYQDIAPLIEEIKVLQKFSFTNNRFYLLWDHQKFLPLYVSDNVSSFGYTPKEIYGWSLFQTLKIIYWKQIYLAFKMHRDGTYFRKLTNYPSLKNQETIICGAKLKDKWGNVRTYFAKQKFVSENKQGAPTISFIEAEEITPIVKGEVGWCRMIDYSFDIPVKRVFFSSGSKDTANELLSNREIDILQLIIKNKSSAEIANELHVSVETVKKHRKNMIARVGAKDMTALIYLCQQAGVI